MRDISRYENEYLKADFEKYQVIQRRKKVLESIRGKRKIVEIGCGMDPLFKYIDWQVDEYTIFEPGKRFIENAKEVAQSMGKNVLFVNELFEDSTLTNIMGYDSIVCSGLLHEVQFPDELLKSIYYASNSETLIHINVPNANSFHRLLAKEMNIIVDTKQFSERNINLQQNSVFDLDTLNRLCNDTGFRVDECGSYFVKPFTHVQMKSMMDNGIIDEKILDGLYFMTKYMPDMGSEIYVNCRRK